MTREQAIAIRTRQLQGGEVDPGELQEAMLVIATTNVPVTAGREWRMRKGTKPRKVKAAPEVDAAASEGVDMDAVYERRADAC